MRNDNLLELRVSEIWVKQIHINQGVGVFPNWNSNFELALECDLQKRNKPVHAWACQALFCPIHKNEIGGVKTFWKRIY